MKTYDQEKLKQLVREKERINKKIILELGLIEDYEKAFKEKSNQLFGRVKSFYTVQEASKLTGYSKSSIYYYANIGTVKVKKGRLTKDDVYILFTLAN